MMQHDFEPFVAMMAVLADAYGQPRLSENATKLYFRVLSEYSLDEVSRAIVEHLKRSPFMPKPCDIIQTLEGTSEDRAAVAWYHVLKAVSMHGHYRSVKFDDPTIHYAIEHMGGWQRFCQITEAELPFREKDFIKHYVRGERIANWDNVPKRLIGKVEMDNALSGWSDAKPETIFIKTREVEKKMLDAGYKE